METTNNKTSQSYAQNEEARKPSISITPDTFINEIYDEFYEVYPYIHLRILMPGKNMFDPKDDIDPTLTLAECGPEELMNYDTRKTIGTISLDANRSLEELQADFNQYGLNAWVYYIDGEELELRHVYYEFNTESPIGEINEECESWECPPYKVGDEWPYYDDNDNEEEEEEEEVKINNVVVKLNISGHAYGALDSNEKLVEGEFYSFYNPDGFKKLIVQVDGKNIVEDIEKKINKEYSNYKTYDIKWKDKNKVVTINSWDEEEHITWTFNVKNFDFNKLSFYYQCYDVNIEIADYCIKQIHLDLMYDGQEIEVDDIENEFGEETIIWSKDS